MGHRFALNVELVEDDFRPEDFFVERGGVCGGFTPNDFDAQVVGDLNQAVEKSGAHAANVFAQPPDDMRMDGHEVHNEAMAPTAAAVGEAQQFRVGLPRGAGDEHEGEFGAGIFLNRGAQLREAGGGLAVAVVVGPAFGGEPGVFEGVADMRVGAPPRRGTPAAEFSQVAFVSEAHLHRFGLAVNVRLEGEFHALAERSGAFRVDDGGDFHAAVGIFCEVLDCTLQGGQRGVEPLSGSWRIPNAVGLIRRIQALLWSALGAKHQSQEADIVDHCEILPAFPVGGLRRLNSDTAALRGANVDRRHGLPFLTLRRRLPLLYSCPPD